MKNNADGTCLYGAFASSLDMSTLQLLIEHGAPVCVVDEEGSTCFKYINKKNENSVIDILTKNASILNIGNDDSAITVLRNGNDFHKKVADILENEKLKRSCAL